MAEMDPVQIAQSGVDPVTGSPLSKDVRKALFRRATVSSSLFARGGSLVPANRPDPGALAVASPPQPQAELLQVGSQLQAIRTDIAGLNTALTRIAELIQADTNADSARVGAEQEAERKLVEEQIRIGKEKNLEKRIQAKLLAPIETLAPKITSIFDRISQSLGFLFAGWLTNQVVEGLKAQSDDNTNKVSQIKTNILKNVGLAIGSIVAIKFGFGAVIRGVTGITSKILVLLGKGIAKPFQGLRNLLPGARAAAPAAAAPAAAGARGVIGSVSRAAGSVARGLPLLGGALSAASSLSQGEGLGKAVFGAGGGMAGGAAGVKIGATLGPLGALAGGAAGFLLGESLGKQGFSLLGGEEQKQNVPQPSSSATQPIAAAPMVQPQQTITGAPAAPQLPPESTSASTSVTPQDSATPSAFNLNLDIGKVFGQQQQTVEGDRKESQIDPNQPASYGEIDMSSSVTEGGAKEQKKEQAQMPQISGQVTSAAISPANLRAAPKQDPQVGPLPEQKPEVIAINAAQQQQPSVPISQNPKTDVPLIKSSNPDNFYVLYSQVNYNVVM
jgi:hypothetical protein